MELYRLKPPHNLLYISRMASVGVLRAAAISIHCWIASTIKEKRIARKLQKIYGGKDRSDPLILAAPQKLPYRNEVEIRNLFERLRTPIESFEILGSCYVVRI